TGALNAVATLSGTGGTATARGKGKAEVTDCKVSDHPVLLALSGILQLPELRAPRFDECLMEFEVGSGVVRTTVLSLKGKTLELTGKGTYGLATSALAYDMTLGLSRELLARVPGNTTRAAFKTRADGFGTLDFGVTGTAAAPKVDLLTRFGVSLATEAAKEGIRKLFGKKKNP
ncbi:MAG TPA: AsmA-like C-terminal region-containing protein, partial [Vicinamibacteria bacterium]|nr:AsmA-like C-terminal region-containing protein [Vicinamibacteria bacterium]